MTHGEISSLDNAMHTCTWSAIGWLTVQETGFQLVHDYLAVLRLMVRYSGSKS